MTKFQLTISTKQLSKKSMAFVYVAWALFGIGFGFGLHAVIGNLAVLMPNCKLMLYGLEGLISICGAFLYTYIVYQVAMARWQGRGIVLNENGIGLPPSCLGAGAPSWIPFSELQAVKLGRSMFGFPVVNFEGKRFSDHVRLDTLSKEDQEQLLLAIQAWAPSAVWAQKLTDYRCQLSAENEGTLGFSHTKLFDDELSRRFSAPTFVPLEPDKQLRSGTIKIVKQIAFGGFSAVYLAVDDASGRVVLKESVVPSTYSQSLSEKARELFSREALTLRSLNHPGIAKVYDFFVENGRSYIVIQFIDGSDLRKLVSNNGPQPEEIVIEWALSVVDVLKYLHQQAPPIVHRDVAPDNLVVSGLGKIVLIDFGASNQYLGTATGTLVGKHSYMAPEQIRGKAEPASDIFSLGATMHFLLTGVEPQALSVSQPADVNSGTSKEISLLVSEMTQLDPKLRIRNAEELYDKLSAIAKRGNPLKNSSSTKKS
ncbi:MAG: serine/threonine protein kinase [Candidatus Obscuribacterales bacterium]|nr:serine/threonine protein kinase [Candidatus Obscuribacterales bacterium]